MGLSSSLDGGCITVTKEMVRFFFVTGIPRMHPNRCRCGSDKTQPVSSVSWSITDRYYGSIHDFCLDPVWGNVCRNCLTIFVP